MISRCVLQTLAMPAVRHTGRDAASMFDFGRRSHTLPHRTVFILLTGMMLPPILKSRFDQIRRVFGVLSLGRLSGRDALRAVAGPLW
jgi:hypothetical protein